VVEASWRELQAILDAELERLPENLRAPFVLCCLERHTLREAACRLGWKPGTVSGRLHEARKLLRVRLARRGVSLSAALCGLALAGGPARAALPAELAADTVRASLRAAAGGMAAGRLAAVVLVVAAAVAVGVGVNLRSPGAPAAEHGPDASGPASSREADAPARPRADRFGDPLPPGTIARLGSTRFAHSWMSFGVAWSPDGKVIASIGGFSSARPLCLWDAATGKELHDIAAEGMVTAVAFTPDGGSLWALERRGLLLWDVTSGKEVRRIAVTPGGRALALAPGGGTLAVGEPRKGVRVLDVATGRPLHEFAGVEVFGLAFSPDGQGLVAAATDPGVVAWDLTTGKERWRTKEQGKGNATVAFAPDGKSVASVGSDTAVRLWDAATGKELRALDDKMSNGPGVVAFSPDGRTLAAPGADGSVVLWDAATGKEIRRWNAASYRLTGVCFSPDGRALATGSVRGSRIRLWDPATGKPLRPVDEHDSYTDAISFSGDGKTLWSLGQDKNLIRWDVATGRGQTLFGGPKYGLFDRAAYSPDGRLVATGGRVAGQVRLWDTTGRELAELGQHEGGAGGVAFSPDGKLLVSSGADKRLRLWDVATRKEIRQLGGPAGMWNSLSFSAGGRRLAVGGGGGFGNRAESPPRVLDVTTGKEVVRLDGSPTSVLVALAPDGKTLAAGGYNNGQKPLSPVCIWDATTGKLLGQLAGHAKGVGSMAFSPDGRYLATGGNEDDSTARLCELLTGGEVACLRGHHCGVSSLAFAPDGKVLATGGGDATILLWDLSGPAVGGPERPQRLTPADLGRCWKALQDPEAAAAYRAVRALAADPARSVPFLKEHLPPVKAVEPDKLKKLLADLNADGFKVREQAEAEILRLGDAAESALRKLRFGEAEAEARERVARILETLTSSPERLRLYRAVAALEYAATPESRRVLEELANGAPDTRLTNEARATVDRLKGLAADRP
jgi:WD40 repeat protein